MRMRYKMFNLHNLFLGGGREAVELGFFFFLACKKRKGSDVGRGLFEIFRYGRIDLKGMD